MKDLRALTYWIFDMDGTLTVQDHDFSEMREALGVPQDQKDILRYLATLPKEIAKEKHQWLLDYGFSKAAQAKANIGAIELLQHLHQKGVPLGILTRNSREVALRTLTTIGAIDFFKPEDILGRDEAPPKPDPASIMSFLNRWQGKPARAVMVGDSFFDLYTGRNAGTTTILVNCPQNDWEESTDFHFDSCADILKVLRS